MGHDVRKAVACGQLRWVFLIGVVFKRKKIASHLR
jgi:hypothetical protein